MNTQNQLMKDIVTLASIFFSNELLCSTRLACREFECELVVDSELYDAVSEQIQSWAGADELTILNTCRDNSDVIKRVALAQF